MHLFWMGIYHGVAMFWETLWALVLGFGISAALQVFVRKEQMNRMFGPTNLKKTSPLKLVKIEYERKYDGS
jgi:uncharacterized membrane protein YraQ (UPF0718 family)